MIPKILKNFNLYVGDDDPRYAGKCSVTLPTLTINTEEHRAGGMDAPVAIDMGMNAIDIEFSLSEYDPTALSFFGISGSSENLPKIIAKGALQGDDGEVTSAIVTAIGIMTETNLGAWVAGEMTENTFKINCRYYSFDLDGTVIHEIDTVNMIRMINGTDQLEPIRGAIGL